MGRSFLPVPTTRARAGAVRESGDQSVKKPRVLRKTRANPPTINQQLTTAPPSVQSDPTNSHSLRNLDSAYSGLGYSWSDIEAAAPPQGVDDSDSIPAQVTSSLRPVSGTLARRSSNKHMQALLHNLDNFVGQDTVDVNGGYLTTSPSEYRPYDPQAAAGSGTDLIHRVSNRFLTHMFS